MTLTSMALMLRVSLAFDVVVTLVTRRVVVKDDSEEAQESTHGLGLDDGGLGGGGSSDRAVEVVHGRRRLHPRVQHPLEAAEQVAVVVLAELRAEEVERERVDARVDVGQAEAQDLEVVPELVVVGVVEVEPEEVDVARQPTQDEDKDEAEDYAGHFLPGRDLALLVQTPTLTLARHLLTAPNENLRHHQVEGGDDNDRDGEEDDEPGDVVDPGYQGREDFVREVAADPEPEGVRTDADDFAAEDGVRECQDKG